MLTTKEISEFINEPNLTRIVTLMEEKQLHYEQIKYFLDTIVLKKTELLNYLLTNNSFLTLLLEAKQAQIFSLPRYLINVAYRDNEYEAAVIKMLSICEQHMLDSHRLELLNIACTKGMDSLANVLLTDPKVCALFFRDYEIAKENNRHASLPEAFTEAVKQGNTTIVELFLPIIKEGVYGEYQLSSLINNAKLKEFSKVVELLNSLPQAKAIEVQKKFNKFTEERDLCGIIALMTEGFDDVSTMFSALLKAIEIDDYPIFEYLLSFPKLQEYAIKLANTQSSDGAMYDDRCDRLVTNCINKTAQLSRTNMLRKFIEIDPSAVSNSAALEHAVSGKQIDHAMFDLLVTRTRFIASRSMMHTITSLLEKSDNDTIHQIFAKFSSDAPNQEFLNTEILKIVCAVIEHAGSYSDTPSNVLPVLQFPVVTIAIEQDNDCKVLKQFIVSNKSFSIATLEQLLNESLKSGKVQIETKNINNLLLNAIRQELSWMVDILITIPEVIESLQNNSKPYFDAAEYALKARNYEASPEIIAKLQRLTRNTAAIKEREISLANAQYITNQIKKVVETKPEARASKSPRLSM